MSGEPNSPAAVEPGAGGRRVSYFSCLVLEAGGARAPVGEGGARVEGSIDGEKCVLSLLYGSGRVARGLRRRHDHVPALPVCRSADAGWRRRRGRRGAVG